MRLNIICPKNAFESNESIDQILCTYRKLVMVYFKILLPAILCSGVIFLTLTSVGYYPVIFGLVVGVVNWKSHKYNPALAIIYITIASYISFFIGLYLIGPIGEIFAFLGNDLRAQLGLQISPYVISPCLLFIFLSYIYGLKRDNFFFIIMILSIIILLTIINLFRGSFNFEFQTTEFYLPFVVWPVIISIGFQMALYREELFKNSNLIKMY